MQNKNPKSLFGIDINEYSKDVNFKVLATKINFLYVRSSGSASGRFRTDRKFVQYVKEARNYGIPVGAYHYSLPSYDLVSADKQCDDFIDVLQTAFGPNEYGDLFPVLDVEEPKKNKISVTALVNWIDRFRKRFEKKTRRRLMLYTGINFLDLYNNFQVPGKGYPLKNMILWIAMYPKIQGNPPYPKNQGGWTRWRIWQFSEDLAVSGVGSPVDANWGPDSIELLMQPSIVEGLKAKWSGNNILVTWDTISDVDLLGYNLFVNSNWVGTVDEKDTSFVIENNKLPYSQFGSYTVSIEAFDYDGEVSKKRSKVEVYKKK